MKGFFGEALGLTHLLENHGCSGNPKAKLRTDMTSMKHIFEFQWRNELNRTTSRNKTTGGNKLRTVYTFKKNFVYEKYLDLQADFTLRRIITKLRISSHQLEIERGRYCSKKRKQERVEKEKRLCKNCSSGEVEDEEHVVMMCPKYDHARRTMLNSLTEAFPPLENLTKHETFLFIMRCHDWEVADALSKMLATVRCERGSL